MPHPEPPASPLPPRQDRWLALAYDPVAAEVLFLGLGRTEAEAVAKLARADAESDDALYRRVFFFYDQDLYDRLFAWLRAAGVPSDSAHQLIRGLVELLGDLNEEARRRRQQRARRKRWQAHNRARGVRP